MKKTRLIDLITTIKRTKVSFISVAIFTALSIGMYLGFTWVGEGLTNTSNIFASDDGHNLHDIEIAFPYGFSEENVKALEKLDDIDIAEGRRIVYKYLPIGDNRYVMKVVQKTRDIDKLYLKEGTLPDECGEAAIGLNFAEDYNISVGDTITLDADESSSISMSKIMSFDSSKDDVEEFFEEDSDSGNCDYLNTNTFTITAIVVSPEYALDAPMVYGFSPSSSLNIDGILIVDEASFNEDAFLGYTDVTLSCRDYSDVVGGDDSYNTYISNVSDEVDAVIGPIAKEKKEAVIEKEEEVTAAIDAKIDEYQEQIDEASEQIDEKQELIDEGEEQIAEAEEQIEDGKAQLADAKAQMEDAQAQLADGKAQLESAKSQIDSGDAQIEEGKEELEASRKEWQAGYEQLEEGKKELAEAISEYDYEKCVYDGAVRDLAIVKSIFERFESALGDIRSGKVNYLNYNEYLEKWDLGDDISTLESLAEKYKGQYDFSIEIPSAITDVINGGTLTEDSITEFQSAVESLYNDGLNMINSFENQLKEAEIELSQGLDLIHEAQAQINSGQAQVDYGKAQLDDAQQLLDEKEQELNDAKNTYEDGLAQYNEKMLEYEAALDEYDAYEVQIENGETELQDKKTELEEAKEKLSEARDELQSAIEQFEEKKVVANTQIDEMSEINSDYSYSILDRSSVIFLNTVRIMGDVVSKLKYSLAGLFVIIGILVCYSAVTRMVYIQMNIIGTKKALGYRDFEIAGFYLSYIGLSGIAGGLFGILVGVAVERIIMSGMLTSLLFEEIYHVYSVTYALPACAIMLAILILIAFIASKRNLSKEAIELLAGETAGEGKNRFYEKTAVFKKMSFIGKTIVNNCMNDKRRVFGTVIGILGCTALVVTSLTFYLNINMGFTKQFSKFFHFNYLINFDSSLSENAQEEILEVAKKYSDKTAVVRRDFMLNNQPDDTKGCVFIYVPDDVPEFSEMVEFELSKGQEGDPYEGVWFNNAYLNYYGDEAGDELNMYSVSGDEVTLPITGYFEHYIAFGDMFVSKDYYEEYFEKEYEPNTVLVDVEDDEVSEMLSELSSIDGYINATNYYDSAKYAFEVFSEFASILVAVYLVLAIVMSVLILLNLLNQFIDEKKKELIVMLINGFEYKDAKRYIYSDTIVLAVIGLLFGTVLGTAMGMISVSNFASAMICFYNKISIVSCIFGIVFAGLLTALMTIIALRKIDKFELTDIGK